MSRHSVFETDTCGLLAGRGLFLLFNFYLQLSYDRLSFVSEITFFLDNGYMCVCYFSLFPSFSCDKTSVFLKVRFLFFFIVKLTSFKL